MNCSKSLVLCVALVAAGCGVEPQSAEFSAVEQEVKSPDVLPTGRGIGTTQKFAKGGGSPTSSGINYHGGPVMLGTTNVYYIWYGNWSNNTATTILPDLASNIGGSRYYNINTTYLDGSNRRVSNSVAYKGSITDSYSRGTSLTDSAIQAVVTSAISSGKLPLDANAVYFVLTSADVTASSGFCSQYCGWHTYTNYNGVTIKYSFVGNPDRCPSSCAMQNTSPNGNAGADGMASIIAHELVEAVTDADGMASIIAHELVEAVTDPQLNAWYDRRGYENADKCAWTFGTTSTASNGSKYNITLGARQYLIQQNWVNAGSGACTMSY